MKTPKIAIRVENKSEYEATISHMKSIGYEPSQYDNWGYDGRQKLLRFENPFAWQSDSWIEQEKNQYVERSFQEFALISGVKEEDDEILINTQDVQYRVKQDMTYAMLLGGHNFFLYHKDLEKIYEAYKSLQ